MPTALTKQLSSTVLQAPCKLYALTRVSIYPDLNWRNRKQLHRVVYLFSLRPWIKHESFKGFKSQGPTRWPIVIDNVSFETLLPSVFQNSEPNTNTFCDVQPRNLSVPVANMLIVSHDCNLLPSLPHRVPRCCVTFSSFLFSRLVLKHPRLFFLSSTAVMARGEWIPDTCIKYTVSE